MAKISDFFDRDSVRQISKHDDKAYEQVDIDILDFYRFINWIEEELCDEEAKYEFSEDNKQADAVEVVRYNQKQALQSLRERLTKELWDYFYDKELLNQSDNNKN
jgi:hypothetical protein